MTDRHHHRPLPAARLVHPARVQPLRRLAHPPRRERVGQPGARGARPPHRRAAPGAGEPAHLRRRRLPRLPAGHGQWVRNVRANDGRLDLLLGRRRTPPRRPRAGRRRQGRRAARLPPPLEARGRPVLRRRRRRQRPTTTLLGIAPRATRCSASMLPTEPTRAPAGHAPLGPRREIIDAAFAILDDEGARGAHDAPARRRRRMRAPSLYKHVPDKAAPRGRADRGRLLRRSATSSTTPSPDPGDAGVVRSVLHAVPHPLARRSPNRYRLATSGRLRRDLLPECLEEWAGQPFFFAAGDPFRSQALWSFAHGMVILEIDGRYPDGSDLDRTWKAGAAAFNR